MIVLACLFRSSMDGLTPKAADVRSTPQSFQAKEKDLISYEIRSFLVETTGLEPVTSCV